HEGENDDGELLRHFLRTDQPTEKLWFSFDYGDAHFISLDYRYPDNKEMTKWFIRDISSSDARWKFVYFHRPAYNLGGHRSTWGRSIWPDLFSEYQVDIVFAGHSHLYERFFPMQKQHVSGSWPVTYITTGGAGAGLYEVMQHTSLAVAESVNHFVNVDISGDTLNLKAVRNDNSLLDEFTIIKKGAGHTPAYNALVQSQERVDLLTSLTNSISLAMNYVPLARFGAPHVVTLKSCVNEDIPFRIELTEDSAQAYKMNAFTGILKAKEETDVPLEIYSNTNSITISNWGAMSPELRLKLIYTYDSIEETIMSGKIRYRPSVY
ncbi:MAG: metallophosphoesterase, partial [Bacteroidota bacterium]